MNLPSTGLQCPKCASEMRSYERNGVTVDQCTSCKGVYLDRGELDRLIDAEGSFYAAPAAPQRQYRDSGDHYRHGKKKHSFLSELFD